MRMRRNSGVLLALLTILIIASTIYLTPPTSDINLLYEKSYLVADDSGPSITRFQFPDGSSFYRDYSGYTSIDVSDEDGVDQVWCSYRKENDTEWMNVSMGQRDSDTYSCVVFGYLEEFRTTFHIHFHANDTNGMSSTSELFSEVVYYDAPDPPPNSHIPDLIILLTAAVFGISIIVVLALRRRKSL
ncbi:MAG: hypothetical protein RTU30_06785 [Candidatus Thorarchaeota archaeon]